MLLIKSTGIALRLKLVLVCPAAGLIIVFPMDCQPHASSKSCLMISPSGFSIQLTQHIRKEDQ